MHNVINDLSATELYTWTRPVQHMFHLCHFTGKPQLTSAFLFCLKGQEAIEKTGSEEGTELSAWPAWRFSAHLNC